MELGFDISIIKSKNIHLDDESKRILFRIFQNKQVKYKAIFMNSKLCFTVEF